MKATEAKAALLSTVEDIAREAREASLETDVKCLFGDVDFNEYEEFGDKASILFAELTVKRPEVNDSIIYESAVGIDGDEVTDDELTSEISKMRASVRELIAALSAAEGSAKEFEAQIRGIDGDDEENEPDAPVHDNKSFYIAAGVAAAVFILLFLLIGKLF